MNCRAYAHGKLSKRTKAKCLQGFQKNKLAPMWPEYAESEPGFLELQYSTQMTKQKSLAKYRVDRIGGHTSTLAGCFGAMFWATTHAADAIPHVMKNAVHGGRVVGEARIAGP